MEIQKGAVWAMFLLAACQGSHTSSKSSGAHQSQVESSTSVSPSGVAVSASTQNIHLTGLTISTGNERNFLSLVNRNSPRCLGGASSPTAEACAFITDKQALALLNLGGNYFQILQKSTNKCIQLWDGTLSFEPCNSDFHAQHWQFSALDEGQFSIKSRTAGKCLESLPALAASECKPTYWSQHWGQLRFWNLANRHSLRCLGGVSSPSADSCSAGSEQQAFSTIGIGDNNFQILQKSSGKCVQLWNGTLSLEPCNSDYHAQHWLFSPVDENLSLIKSRTADKCLDSVPSLVASDCRPNYWSQHWEKLRANQYVNMQAPLFSSDCAGRNYIRGWKNAAGFWEPDWWGDWIDNTNSRCSQSFVYGFPLSFWHSTEFNGGVGAYWPLGAADWNTRGQTFDSYYTKNEFGNYTATLKLDLIKFDDCSLASQQDSCPDCVCRSREYNIVQINDGQALRNEKRYLDENWMMDVELRLVSSNNARIKNSFWGSVRVGCGAIATDSSGRTYFTEVTLWTLGDVDRCPSGPSQWGTFFKPLCDPDGSYVRRSTWSNGETYYVLADRASGKIRNISYIPMLPSNGSWQTYRFPISKLFTNYPDWQVPMSGRVELQTASCMIESLGEASAELEIRNQRTYSIGR